MLQASGRSTLGTQPCTWSAPWGCSSCGAGTQESGVLQPSPGLLGPHGNVAVHLCRGLCQRHPVIHVGRDLAPNSHACAAWHRWLGHLHPAPPAWCSYLSGADTPGLSSTGRGLCPGDWSAGPLGSWYIFFMYPNTEHKCLLPSCLSL